jgi:pyruvate,water dikinase
MKTLFNRLRGRTPTPETYTVWLAELPPESMTLAGGKATGLGNLMRAGLPVPPGFVVTADAFRAFLDFNGGIDMILSSMRGLDVETEGSLKKVANTIREFIVSKPLPPEVEKSIHHAYTRLGPKTLVAVRSSAVSEDSQAASFAGQQETFLNIQGAEAVVRHIQDCWASFFSPRSIFYRAQKGSLSDSAMAVVVQKMINPDKSGVLFTVDPVQKQRDHLMIEAAYGLGEAVVSGLVTPDQYVMDKNDGAMVRKYVPVQSIALVYDESGSTHQIELPVEKGTAQVVSDAELTRLAELGIAVERHFGEPQDIEWCILGNDIYLLQSRPITTL